MDHGWHGLLARSLSPEPFKDTNTSFLYGVLSYTSSMVLTLNTSF
jgi:hypothetical protein